MKWKDGVPVSVSVKSLCGNKTTVIYKDFSYKIELKKGERIELGITDLTI